MSGTCGAQPLVEEMGQAKNLAIINVPFVASALHNAAGCNFEACLAFKAKVVGGHVTISDEEGEQVKVPCAPMGWVEAGDSEGHEGANESGRWSCLALLPQ